MEIRLNFLDGQSTVRGIHAEVFLSLFIGSFSFIIIDMVAQWTKNPKKVQFRKVPHYKLFVSNAKINVI